MRKEAEEYAKTDKEKEDLIDIRNQADQIAYSSEKMLSESKDKLTEEMVTNLDNATKELRKVQNEEDKDKIKEKMEELNKVSQEAGKHIHEQAQKDQQPKEGEEATKEEDKKPEEGTQEGDYEEN
jgi:molecular chaperone DnaK